MHHSATISRASHLRNKALQNAQVGPRSKKSQMLQNKREENRVSAGQLRNASPKAKDSSEGGKSKEPSPVRSILRGSGDHTHSNNDDSKVDPKKLYLISSFVMYAAILFLSFGANCVYFIILCTRKMEYYLRNASYFDVVFDAHTMMIKFIVGTSCHIVTTLYTIFVLKGVKTTESLVLRFKERFLSWLLISAIFGESFIIASVVDYFMSRPLVQNGLYPDTIAYPRRPPGGLVNCFKNDTIFRGTMPPHIMVNLAWMTQILCKSDKDKELLWGVWNSLLTPTCNDLKKKLTQKEKDDCSLAISLDLFQYSHLVVAFLGMLYCFCLWYIYLRSEVHTKPGRFSLVPPLAEEELHDLREAAEKVKNFTSQQLGNTGSDKENGGVERGSKIKFAALSQNPPAKEKAGANQVTKVGSSPSKMNLGPGAGGSASPSKTKVGASPSKTNNAAR